MALAPILAAIAANTLYLHRADAGEELPCSFAGRVLNQHPSAVKCESSDAAKRLWASDGWPDSQAWRFGESHADT